MMQRETAFLRRAAAALLAAATLGTAAAADPTVTAMAAWLPALAPRIRDLQAKYAVAMEPLPAAPLAVPAQAAAEAGATAARGGAQDGDANAGKAVFDGTCAHCHGPNALVADRKINLRLLSRKYGAQMNEVFFTPVTNGRPTKGMPTWKEVFRPQDFANILAYLRTVQEP